MTDRPALRVVRFGDVPVAIFDFKRAGDTLEMHNHTYENVHFTIVARGAVKVHGPDVPEKDLKAGGCIDFIENHPHEIIALEDNSRIFNVLKHIHAQPKP